MKKGGFSFIRQKGSHRFYRHQDGRSTIVPIHANKDIGRGLLLAILKEMKIDRGEFFRKYK
ncbi:type II toxin-antitoxin system HicA family toxin [Candidatus Woesearchaeota archaeon]|nr:type II toxin-antitoxin system HicA family toxin [Candidatus Woesearchaeota archaeon]